MKKLLQIGCLILITISAFGQSEPVVVSEQTIKVSGEKELYYGFAAGDEIIFNLDVVKGKNVKEVEIVEYPYSSKFFDFKTKKISDQRITVNKTGIYKFRIKGGGLGTKICRAQILRVPSSAETKNFDTSIKWKVRLDSSYVTKYVKELVSVDTVVVSVADRVERVHSQTNLSNSNITRFNLNLPQNKTSEFQTSELISWAYWIGVGNEGQQAFETEKKKFLMDNTAKVGAMIDPVAGLALGAYAMLTNPPQGDNVKYWITTYMNGVEYSLGQGNSVVSSGRVTEMKQGGFTVTLQNDNIADGINTTIKISAIMLNKKYANRSYEQLQVKQFKYPVLSVMN